MTSHDELIDDVLTAQKQVKDAEDELTQRIRDRADAIRVALDAGAGAQPIAEALGLSRHRVYQMRDAGRR